MGKCKITSVQQNGHNINPIIVGWENGSLKEDFTSTARCTIEKNPLNGNLNSIEVNLAGDLVYEGKFEEKPLCRTFIAVRSKNKKKPTHSKVKLFEATSTLLSEKKFQHDLDEKYEVAFNKDDKFYKVFGSKKGLLRHQTNQNLNIVSGTSVRDTVRESLSVVKVEDEDIDIKPDTNTLSVLPVCNRTAARKEDVYSVDSIIPEDIMLELNDHAEFIINCVKESKILSIEEYTPFFIDSISVATKSSSVKIEPDVLKDRVKMLIFCELLLKLINSNQLKRDVLKSNFILIKDLPLTNQYILDTYSSFAEQRRHLTYEMKDKVICHVMILTLLACCYVINVQSLCSSISKYSSEKLRPILSIVGVTPVSNTNNRLYVLKTPLPPLPVVSNVKRGTKRKRS